MRVVIPSYFYGDFLATTLPAWRAFLPEARITVVTTAEDELTKRVARSVSRVDLLETNIWTRNGAVLNKAGALDEGFARPIRPPARGDVCLAIDADVYPCGVPPDVERLRVDTVYGCARYECRTPAELEAHLQGRTSRHELALILPRRKGDPPGARMMSLEEASRACLGYFQLFRYAPDRSFGWSKTAGGYDNVFRQRFVQRRALLECYVLHLGDRDRRNWVSRVLPTWPTAIGASA